jgi:uncharacterized protein YdeI (YjbR/CyaY-like superfamily)
MLYGNQKKTAYNSNGISYTIIEHEGAVIEEYSIDFVINETDKVQYSYMINETNLQEVKKLIDSIRIYTIENK